MSWITAGLLLEKAELSVAALFFVGMMKCPSEMMLLQEDAAIADHEFRTNVSVLKGALFRHELPPRIYDAQGQEAWEVYSTAARSFCEKKWPERLGKSKSVKKLSRPRTIGTVTSALVDSSTSTCASASEARPGQVCD